MEVLLNADQAIISIEKFTEYALHPIKGKGKALAFEQALGYNLSNAEKLMDNIRTNLNNFEAKLKGDNAFGLKYEVLMNLTGENGKTASVMTSWILEYEVDYPRLTSAYVKNRRQRNDK